MHREKVLTAAAVRNLGPGFHSDGNGLFLKVDPSGARRWVQRIVVLGKRRDIGLGSAKLVTLVEAREKALQQRKVAREGEDPLAAKRRLQGIPTFGEAAKEVYAHNEGGWKNEKHKKQWLSSLEKYAFPHIGSMRLDKIDSSNITLALDEVWLTRPATADRVKQRIGKVMQWAKARGYRLDNPADGVQEGLAKRDRSSVKHMKALPFGEVANAIATVAASKASDATKLAFQFLVHTACRSGEVRGALWSEIDLNRLVLTIPAERMKKKRIHRVPLTPQTIAILEQAKTLRREDTDLVFPSATGKMLSDMTISKLIKDLKIAAVPHGFRSSFRDWAGEATHHPREVIEFALAHVISDKAEAAYARSDLFEKRRLIMVDWSDFLATPIKNDAETVA